jgi:hypothetical protein
MAAIAMSRASFAVTESKPVINWASLARPMIIKGFPSDRFTLARHFPGDCSKAFTMSCLYSTVAPRILLDKRHAIIGEAKSAKNTADWGYPSPLNLAMLSQPAFLTKFGYGNASGISH